MFKAFVLLMMFIGVSPAWAALKVFATVPEWAALAKEIGGEEVTVYMATHGLQDPHRVEAKPSLIARARSADLLVATGAELEIGWLPLVVRESGNAAIQVGQLGHFEAASFVRMLEVPTRLDRADGDIHAAGNPHVHLDPRNIIKLAAALTSRMAQLDSENAAHYRSRSAIFERKWQANIQRWEQQSRPLRGANAWQHHRSFSYLFDWLGVNTVGSLEPKPGVEPTSAHLVRVIADMNANRPRFVVRATYQSDRASSWVSAQTGVAAIALPVTVGGSEAARDLTSLFDEILARLMRTARE